MPDGENLVGYTPDAEKTGEVAPLPAPPTEPAAEEETPSEPEEPPSEDAD